MHRYVFFLLLAILMWCATVQSQSAVQYIARGDKELHDGYPQSALFYYRKALSQDTNLPEANFKAAECYRLMRNYKKAGAFYRATADADANDEYLEALFWLGQMQKQMGEYKEAKRSFQYFLSVYRQRDDLYRWAREEEASCDWALDHRADEPKYKVTPPDSGLNTVHAEMSPFMTDTNTLYFATMRYESDIVKKGNPVYVELKKAVKDSAWHTVPLDIPVQDATAHIGNGCFSADSSRFYFSKCPTTAECRIYMIRKSGGSWGQPEELPEPVNVAGSLSTQPAVTTLADNTEYLFFTSDRNTGKGGMDLWFVDLKQGNPTTRLRNLGNRINTKGDEITPWYDARDSTLYFSSNRQPGFGGFDLFKSQGEPGSFNIVENLGTGVNSPADDYYLMFRSSDSLGYFASNRNTGLKEGGNETCCNDLYRLRPVSPPDTIPADTMEQDTLVTDTVPVVVTPVEVPETIEQLQQLLPISLYFHNDRPNPRSTATVTTRTYLQTIYEYLSLEEEYMKAIESSALSPAQKDTMRTAISSFFSNDLAQSVEQLDMAMNVLLAELEKGAQIELAVKGYASPLANSDYNLNLTYRRINAMENYIRSYRDGAFIPYLDAPAETEQGRLVITKIPYGETQASSGVSDSLNDTLGAIYSLRAARERRIEILRIERQ